jgi:hypothetical protein
MTNWKDAFDSPFMSSYELDGPVQLTVDRVEQNLRTSPTLRKLSYHLDDQPSQ